MERYKKINLFILNIYCFLFVLTMFNRELIPFGIDLRYIQVILGMILIGSSGYEKLIKKNGGVYISKFVIIIIIFYIFFILVNFKWLNNGLIINISDFINMVILSMSNLLTILIAVSYKEDISSKYIVKFIAISGMVLFISMILIWIGIPMESIMGGNYPGVYPGVDNVNFLGQEGRIAGYAQDPNYASMFMIILALTALYYIDNRKIKYSLIGIAVFGYLLSASKTIAIAFVFATIMILILKVYRKYLEKYYSAIFCSLVVLISLLPYIVIKIMSFLQYSFNMKTMSTRMVMWLNAISLFEYNPIFGNGITSVRSAFSEQINGWYVHCHSTIFQLMSEMGIVGLVLFIIIMIFVLKQCNEYGKYICIIFLVFCVTSELLHLTLFAFVVGILPLIMNKDEKNYYTKGMKRNDKDKRYYTSL